MTWEQFLALISKEKDEDIIECIVVTRQNFYKFSQSEVVVIFDRDKDTKTYNYTTYTGEVR
jgi:hypothetical protein